MLRKSNMLNILKIVKKFGPVTRPEIAHHTKLTNVTVNTLVTELMKNCIVTEEGLTTSSGGRKAMQYRFNSSAYYIIGVTMRITRVSIDLYDLGANRVKEGLAVSLEFGRSVEDIISEMVSSIKALTMSTPSVEILGIGVAVPGRVDHKRGVIYHLPNLVDWVNIPLKGILEDKTGLPTFIERDVNSHLAYLKWLDVVEYENDVVYFDVEEGIGGSLLMDGIVHHGVHGLAGEIGHTTLNPDGSLCNCGNYGCAETYISHRALLQYYREALELIGETLRYKTLKERASSEKDQIRFLVRLAEEGDGVAQSVFVQASKYVVALILNIINTYDPALIVIECMWLKQNRFYFDKIVSEVFKRTLLLDRNDIKIMLNPVENIYNESSSTIVMEHLFTDINNNRFIR